MQGGQVTVRGSIGWGREMILLGSGWAICPDKGARVIMPMGGETLLGVASHRMQAWFADGKRCTTLLQDS